MKEKEKEKEREKEKEIDRARERERGQSVVLGNAMNLNAGELCLRMGLKWPNLLESC